mmetsp:Transcript_11844/g.35596  ORF Transcript_11844/g.35596 Transcript_11844/m.35596 type:complete len:240 (+) Transcript_11844:381-1100(+)
MQRPPRRVVPRQPVRPVQIVERVGRDGFDGRAPRDRVSQEVRARGELLGVRVDGVAHDGLEVRHDERVALGEVARPAVGDLPLHGRADVLDGLVDGVRAAVGPVRLELVADLALRDVVQHHEFARERPPELGVLQLDPLVAPAAPRRPFAHARLEELERAERLRRRRAVARGAEARADLARRDGAPVLRDARAAGEVARAHERRDVVVQVVGEVLHRVPRESLRVAGARARSSAQLATP